jgi:glycosyltransferase involved in cell wall biosynthesis
MENMLPSRITLVVPCYNEAGVLDAFYGRARATLDTIPDATGEFLFVDDGSTDGTAEVLAHLAERDPRVGVITLSRNFGHQRAISAGCDFATSDYVVVLDADLQDPPELIPQMIHALRAGADVVHMVRSSRPGDSWAKRFTAKLFYALMRRMGLPELPSDAGDFKAFNRTVLEAFRSYGERVRFLRGVFAAMGFRQTHIEYIRDTRHAGKSRYGWRQMCRLALDAFVSFSIVPLRLAALGGVLVWLATALLVTIALLQWDAHSWLDIAILGLVGFSSGGLFLGLWIVGEYVGRLFREAQHRPRYHVRTTRNLPTTTGLPQG